MKGNRKYGQGNMIIIFSGCDERGYFGVGFAVRKNIVPMIKDLK